MSQDGSVIYAINHLMEDQMMINKDIPIIAHSVNLLNILIAVQIVIEVMYTLSIIIDYSQHNQTYVIHLVMDCGAVMAVREDTMIPVLLIIIVKSKYIYNTL